MKRKKIRGRMLQVIALSFILSIVSSVASTHAAPAVVTFTVNNVKDKKDIAPGNGVCETKPGNQKCTLRAAIQEANAKFDAVGGSYKIVLAANTYVLTRVGNEDNAAKGDLDIKANMTIKGADANSTIIHANGMTTTDRAFHVIYGKVKFVGVSIIGGSIPTHVGGGIFNQAGNSLKLVKSIVRDNEADQGGGIYSVAKVKLVRSTIQGNSAPGVGGGLSVIASATLLKSTIRDNDASIGGGIDNAGTLTVKSSTISGNSAEFFGGGISNVSSAKIILINSTISDNDAKHQGGGIYNKWNGSGPLTEVALHNVTIANNLVGVGFTGGGVFNDAGIVRARNSIIAVNLRALSGFPYFFFDDCKGEVSSHDYNLIQSTNGCVITGAVGHNKYGVSPLFDQLQNYGGPTETHALKSNSPAIDAANPNGCVDILSAPLTTDQRGSPRVVDGNGDTVARCDIGAFEK